MLPKGSPSLLVIDLRAVLNGTTMRMAGMLSLLNRRKVDNDCPLLDLENVVCVLRPGML